MLRTLCIAVFVLAACNNAPGGLGIGRPTFTTPPSPAVNAVVITQVYAPSTTQSVAAFVQLENASGAVIDFSVTSLMLASFAGAMDIGSAQVKGGDSSAQWAAGARRSIAITPALQLHASAGELGVFSGTALQGYAVWGSDSSTVTDFGMEASSNGAASTQGAASLPFPVPDTLAVNLDPNVQGACVTPAPAASAATPVACAQMAAPVWLTRVAGPNVDPNGGFIEVYNKSGAPLDIYGMQVCVDGSCRALTYTSSNPNTPAGILGVADANLAPGAVDPARGVLAIGRAATNLAGIVAADIATPGPQGEIFLLRPAANAAQFTASDMLSYMRYGAPNNSNSAAQSAAAGGLWRNDSTNQPLTVIPANVRGESLMRVINSSDPNNWVPSSSAAQTMNPTAPWTSCSYPQEAIAAPVAIVEIANTTPPRVRIANVSDANSPVVVDISGYSLALGADKQPLQPAQGVNLTQFGAGAQLWVEVPTTLPCSDMQNICWVMPNGLGAQEAALIDTASGAPRFFVQWGDSTTSVNGALAMSSSVWPQASCRAPAFSQDLSLMLIKGRTGEGVGDFYISYPTFL